jgi:hypothetical protein
MKAINFDFYLKKLDGTLSDLHCGRELAGQLAGAQAKANALKIFELSKKIYSPSKITVDAADFTLLKETCEALEHSTVLFKAQILEALSEAKETK